MGEGWAFLCIFPGISESPLPGFAGGGACLAADFDRALALLGISLLGVAVGFWEVSTAEN
jgi:hypothetical protein